MDQGVVMPGLDLWVYSAPFEGNDQGGDVHYLSSCGTGRISRLVVADISGHGERVGRSARELRLLLRRFVNYLDQTRFVEALNRSLLSEESGRFATSIAMTYFAPSRQLDVVNAGHPRPLLFRADRREWQLLEAPGPTAGEAPAADRKLVNLPLGVLEPTTYEQFGVKLRPGDMVLCYTDALVEARAGEGEMLGEEGLLAIMQKLNHSSPESPPENPPENLVRQLIATLEGARGGAPAEDDVTMLLLRQHGRRTQAPLALRLLAALRFLLTLARAAVPFGERQPIPWPQLNKSRRPSPGA